MEELKDIKLAWLQRFFYKKGMLISWHNADYILNKLNDLQTEYWLTRQEADEQTHCTESYEAV